MERKTQWVRAWAVGVWLGSCLLSSLNGYAMSACSDSAEVEAEFVEEYASQPTDRREEMQQTRAEIADADTWNLQPLFQDQAAWEAAYRALEQQQKEGWPTVKQPAADGWTAMDTERLLRSYMAISRELSKLYTYAHLRHDEDLSAPVPKAAYERSQLISVQFSEATSWLEPALLALPESHWNALRQSPELKDFSFWFEKLAVQRPHILNASEEKLLAMASMPLNGPSRAFSALQNVDFDYGEITDGLGQTRPLTAGLFGVYLRDSDRILRENAFNRIYQVLGSHIHTLNELLSSEMQAQVFQARARKYPTVLDAALGPQKIPTAVYSELIRAVSESLPLLHRYVELRKEVIGVDALQPYDLYIPLVPELNLDIPYDQAVQWVIESVAPLGEEYQQAVREGLTTGRWVDRYENKGKRSGAYSSGCYDSAPYVLMNYRGTLNDVFTLAHEVGHSMHSWLANRNNSYWDSRYPIFVAEVASTFNEQLLFDLLLKKLKSPAEQLYLINQKIEEIRTTLYRQTQFAEFEWWMHQQVEQGNPLTSQSMNEAYGALNRQYYGPALTEGGPIHQEWARIPHFYYGYYVYQYATGLSSAIALHDQVVKGDIAARDHYLQFLKAGGSQFPLELLEKAGVSLRDGGAVRDALRHFERLLNQMEAIIRSQKGQQAAASR